MRLRELDILRGIAVLLVLFHHHPLITPFSQAGWFGVDLFFVLSGFLVSGLLFKEYRRYGRLNLGRFLIRRGFKIYPLFYLVLSAGFLLESFTGNRPPLRNLLVESLFLQNYHLGIWFHTWSLAVEEHFYLLLCLLMWALMKSNRLGRYKSWMGISSAVLLMCLWLRVLHASQFTFTNLTHLFPTHLRIDSLLVGSCLAYLYHFKRRTFLHFFQSYRKQLYWLSAAMLAPAFLFPLSHPFIHTIGFSFFSLGFACLLALWISDQRINEKLDRLWGKTFSRVISKIGFYSYAIYLIHIPFLYYGMGLIHKLPFGLPLWLEAIIYFIGSILLGMWLTQKIEAPILTWRDRLFPRKSSLISNVAPPGS